MSTTTTKPNGRLLREVRIARGLSIHALAYKAGVSHYAIHLYERYDLVPKSPRVRQKIADALGVSYEELWGELEQQAQQGGATQS